MMAHSIHDALVAPSSPAIAYPRSGSEHVAPERSTLIVNDSRIFSENQTIYRLVPT